ncbi:hypothetical protein Mapa_017249 [Marchantia paleacea]|nr:hypothetical protein Mapa_017249 [Marchantia paleacea]
MRAAFRLITGDWKCRSDSPCEVTTMDPQSRATMGSLRPRDHPLDPRLQGFIHYSADCAGNFGKSFSTFGWKKMSDSVYELNSSSAESTLDVVFFHGLQLEHSSEAHLSTWKSRSENPEIWLKDWLQKDDPSLRVITVSYDASIEKDSRNGRMDLYQVAESLLLELLMAGVGKVRPIILVGHSFGGLIAKQVCLQAHRTVCLGRQGEDIQEKATFLQNLRGLFYFGVPHRGSRFTDVVEKLNIVKGELVDYVKVFSKNLSRLNNDFEALRDKYKWKVAGVGETLPTNLANGLCDVIVDEASATCRNFITVKEDHFSLCQPTGRDSTSYVYLVDFIHTIQVRVTKERSSREESRASATNEQALPKIQVGLLTSLEGGEIQQRLVKHQALGFWGMVGVGKTTLCKAAFNGQWNAFPYTLFAEGVKLIPGDGEEFEEKLLSLLHYKGKKMARAPNLVQLKGKKLLVAFDDVEKEREIELLRKISHNCKESSRFILTSQNRQVLNKMDGIFIYEVARLDWEDSKLLFKNHAFPDDQPLPEWQRKCMEDIVQKCGGLPLILEVVGKYLKTCDSKDVWQQTHELLVKADHGKTVGLDKVWMQLKISYDNLQNVEKQMFTEAATILQERLVELHGWRHGQRTWTLFEAKLLWGVMYGNEALHWRTLVDLSLVSDVPEDSGIRIHELLKHLGNSLAATDDFRIRVDSVEDLSKVIQDGNLKIEKVHTLQVVCKKTDQRFCWKCDLFRSGWSSECAHHFPRLPIANICNMESLRFLQLVDCELGEGKAILPPNVVVFISQNSGENISFAESSRLVYLSMKAFKIQRLPESLCELSNLHCLHLEAGNLLSLPDTFGSLKKLRQLKLIGQNLKELPASFGGSGALQKLHLECDQLKCLPETFGLLRQLQELSLGCETLVSLPLSIGELEALQDLSLRCNGLEKLPDSFGKLVGLRKLELESDKLLCLPESFANLKQLQELSLVCRILPWLPDSFGELEALQDLILQCDNLERLPDSLVDLQALQKLELKRLCSGLGDPGERKVEYLKVIASPGIFGPFETVVLSCGNSELDAYYEYSELRV